MDCKTRGGIDLHIHSTASDGTLSPSAILSSAIEIGLRAIALTDHDTIDGSRAVLDDARRHDIDFITGVEISAEFPKEFNCFESCHILGYGFDPDDPDLTNALATLQTARKNRNPRIVERLRQLGFDLTLHEIRDAQTEHGQIGRPHIARAMVQKGYVRSINEAFDRYLSRGQPAYVDKYRLACDQALDVITRAGGVPVLAHPGLIPFDAPGKLEDFIRLLKSIGLRGLEVYYPEHDNATVARYRKLAEHYGLLITGGSDFHGAIKPAIKLGAGNGNQPIPYELFVTLGKAVEAIAV